MFFNVNKKSNATSIKGLSINLPASFIINFYLLRFLQISEIERFQFYDNIYAELYIGLNKCIIVHLSV